MIQCNVTYLSRMYNAKIKEIDFYIYAYIK